MRNIIVTYILIGENYAIRFKTKAQRNGKVSKEAR